MTGIHESELLTLDQALTRVVMLLRDAGFEHRYTSMVSEATYYALPGFQEQIRVANHSGEDAPRGLPPTVARITIAPNVRGVPGSVLTNHGKLVDTVHRAMGRYLAAIGPKLVQRGQA